MTIEAVVALKTLSQSKRRLSAVLNDEQRSDLVEAMAQDVLSCLMRHPEIEAVHVVCGEGWTRDVLPEGPLVVWQEAESHDHGLIAAHEMVAARTGAERLLFIHADLPFLGQEDISAVIAASLDHHAVFSPDFTETGTNAVLRWRHQSLPRFRSGPAALDCLLQSVFGDFVLLMTFHGEHHLEPVGPALAPQNIGNIRGTVSPNGSQRSA